MVLVEAFHYTPHLTKGLRIFGASLLGLQQAGELPGSWDVSSECKAVPGGSWDR